MNIQTVKTQILVYALPRGDYRPAMEKLISDKCKCDEDVEIIKKAAAIDGYHTFRVTTCNLSIPPKFY